MNAAGLRSHPAPLVVFDGGCGFCRRCVEFAQARDRRGLRFVAWQDADLPDDLRERARSSVLWIADGRVLDRSAAVVRVLWSLHAGWRAVGAIAWLVPKSVRDAAYRAAARRWGPLGDVDACAPSVHRSDEAVVAASDAGDGPRTV